VLEIDGVIVLIELVEDEEEEVGLRRKELITDFETLLRPQWSIFGIPSHLPPHLDAMGRNDTS